VSVKKVAFEFDPFLRAGVSKGSVEDRQAALEEVAEFVKEQVLMHVGDGTSPVEGGAWKRSLHPEYRKRKATESSADFANLELTGAMLDALDVLIIGDKLSLQIEGDEAGKADGNNRGTYGKGRRNRSKAREFIPQKGQTLNSEIIAGIKEVFERHQDG